MRGRWRLVRPILGAMAAAALVTAGLLAFDYSEPQEPAGNFTVPLAPYTTVTPTTPHWLDAGN